MKRASLTLERLKEVLEYSPETGKFHWRVRTSHRVNVGDEAGCLNKHRTQGYVVIGIDGVLYRAHILAWFYMTGEMPQFDIDHKNRDRADNKWTNLRELTRSRNLHNSETKGAYLTKGGKWQSKVTVNYKERYLGTFDTEEEARNATLRAKRTVTEAGCL